MFDMSAPGPRYVRLRQWAQDQGIAPHTAYRRYHAGDLRDADGRRVHAKQDGKHIWVSLDPYSPPPVDPEIDELVKRLRDAGYVLLTRAQARQLGLDPDASPAISESPNGGRQAQ
jgi:hypothetical protein